MTIAVDISYFQPPVDDSYPHRWLIFRACDGSFTDPNAGRNLAWAIRAHATGRLDGFTVYVVYRPGLNATILDTLRGLNVPTDCVVMVDAETWGGQITGNQSTGLNALVGLLVARQGGDRTRVWGYGNRGDLASMWPSRPSWLGMVVASYGGSKPTDVPNIVGWQYTDGQPQFDIAGLPSSSPPFGRCDHNQLYLPPGDDMAMDAATRAALIHDIADSVWNKLIISNRSAAYRLLGVNTEVAAARADNVALAKALAAVNAKVDAVTAAVGKLQAAGATVLVPTGTITLTQQETPK